MCLLPARQSFNKREIDMNLIKFMPIVLLALAAGCGGGGGGGNNATPSQAFVASVQKVAATEADDAEPSDISASKEADDDAGEALVLN
jgi:hypothetical protein